MNKDIGPELAKVISLLEDVRKLIIFSLYKRKDITSGELAEVLGKKGSTIRGMFVKKEKK
jgi:hypothetical protein